jgi:ATP-dependent DNA helicase DinG
MPVAADHNQLITGSALDDPLKARIQDAYRTWLDARDFKPRRGQREMIAAIARVLSAAQGATRIAVIEAGTGTGKTAAYCLAAIPVAQALHKRLLVATATVALQEQIVDRDLPDLMQRSGLEFSFALAKGRQRYVCLKRLDERITSRNEATQPLFETVSDAALALYQRMLGSFGGQWNGEIDSWDEPMGDQEWRAVTTDHRGCTNNRCSFFKQCPFFKARAGLDKADLIVTNLDQVLADLSLGGGAVLPSPEDSIYVLDEAHHLAAKTQQHFTLRMRLRGATQWVDQVNASLGTLTQRFGRPSELERSVQDVGVLTAGTTPLLSELIAYTESLEFEARDETHQLHRFRLGRVPAPIADTAAAAAAQLVPVVRRIEEVHLMLQDVIDGQRSWEHGHEAEDWLPLVGQHLNRGLATLALLQDYAGDNAAGLPEAQATGADDMIKARWVNRIGFESGSDSELVSVPLAAGALLQEVLWSRCFGAICTSATLTALGRFDRFVESTGIPADAYLSRIASPFRYPDIATFRVPVMRSDPRDATAHTDEVVALLPDLLRMERSALVLFSSWRQLHEVVARMPTDLVPLLRVQGTGAKQALLDAHRSRIDAGEPSYIVGVASFAEGVDLPDDYCRHVIIAKLPFTVPDDPLDRALAEWVEARGRNPFFEIALPDASVRLVQACGRLIRHELDHGRITLLDRRIITQRYGRSLLASLPPFRQELPGA